MECIVTIQPNHIYNIDCIKGLNCLSRSSVDLIFADPPFNIGFKYDVYDDRKNATEYLSWCSQWIEGCYRALRPTGSFWLAIGDDFAAELKIASQAAGFHCRSWVIWYYTFGVNCTRKFNRSHTHIFHFVKDLEHFTFNDSEIRIPSARQLVYDDSRANPAGRLPDDTWIIRPQDIVDGLNPDEDVWYFPRVAGTFRERAGFHGCQMPEQLLARIIRVASNPGDLVVDPFSGSATTATVAKKLGRKWIAFDLSEDYVAHGIARVNAALAGDLLQGSPEPRISAPPTIPQAKARQVKLEQRPSRMTHLDSSAERNLIRAFEASSEGYSVDRVVADPNLNRSFLGRCQDFGVPGVPSDINRLLFRLRKAGRLKHIPTIRRTDFSWKDCDQFLFASEIALEQVLTDLYPSLDEILCCPEAAARFDVLAEEFAPGFTPLQYRWAALKLRKEAKLFRHRAASVHEIDIPPPKPLTAMLTKAIAGKPGVYLLTNQHDVPLYAGESIDLGQRLTSHRNLQPMLWSVPASKLKVSAIELHDISNGNGFPQLSAYQSKLISQTGAHYNYKQLANATYQ